MAVTSWAKYTETLTTTTEIKLSVVDYTIDKNKMQTVMRGLTTKPTTVKFVKGTDVPSGLTNIATTTAVGKSVAGIQQDDSSMIGVFQSGTTLYIAPMKAPAATDTTGAAATAANNSHVMHTPVDASYFMCGGNASVSGISDTVYTGLGNTLQEVNFENIDTSRSTSLEGAISRYKTLTTIKNLSKFDTSNVATFYEMFYWNEALTSVDVSSFNTEKANTLAFMFQKCEKLQSITGLTSFNTSSVTNTRGMFQNCYALESLDLSSFNTSKTTDQYVMFNGCNNLAKVTLGKDFKWVGSNGYLPTPSSTYITGATGNWYDTTTGDDYTPIELAGVTRTETRTYVAVPTYTISKDAMQTALRTLASSSPTTLKFVAGNSSEISGLTCVSAASDGIQDTSVGSAKIGVFQNGTTIYIAPMDSDGKPANNSAVMYAPKDCTNFLDGNSTYTNLKSNLTSIECTNLDTSKVTTMDYMFAHYSSLTTLDISFFKNSANLNSTKCMFYEDTAIKDLTISNDFNTSGVTDMRWMFYKCKALPSVNVSGFSTSSATTLEEMFSNCTSLTTLDLSSFKNSSSLKSTQQMFYECNALTSLTIPSDFDTSGVTTMNKMFYNCNALPSVDVSMFSTTNVTNMYQMFYGCKALTSLSVSNFNTAKVTTMEGMFQNCSTLTTLDLSTFDTGVTKSVASMFNSCKALSTLDVSKFNTANVTDMNNMFYNCIALTSLDVSGFNTSKVTKMHCMFQACKALTSITGLDEFDTSEVTNMMKMFSSCEALPKLDLSSFNTSSVTTMESMFGSCYKLAEVTLSKDFDFKGTDGYLPTPSSSYITGADGNWYDTETGVGYAPADQATYHNDLGETRTYVAVWDTYIIDKTAMHTAIKTLTSGNPTSLSFVKGTDSAISGLTCISAAQSGIQAEGSNSIGVFQSGTNIYIAPMDSSTYKPANTSAQMYAKDGELFLNGYSSGINYTGFTSIDLSNLNTSLMTSMRSMFSGCESLTSLTFGDNFDTSNVTNMYSMFNSNGKMTSLDLSSFDTRNVTNMGFMFYCCYVLTDINFNGENFSTSKVTGFNAMFGCCYALTSLDLTKFDTSSATAMSQMFYYCTKLQTVDLSSFTAPSTLTTTFQMFYNDYKLTTITTSSSFNISNTSTITSSTQMFYNCKLLVGGASTAYNSSYIDKTYARIDGGTSSPGYFTAKS